MLNKKIKSVFALASLALLTSAAHATVDGPYLGLQLGVGDTHQDATYNGKGFSDRGLAGRLLAGYQVDEYLAYELGWTRFNNAGLNMNTLRSSVKTNAVDLVVKGMYPMSDRIKLYAKAGGAYVIQDYKLTGSVENGDYSSSTKKLLPTAGVGVSYAFTDQVAMDVSYSRIQSVGSSTIKSTDFAGIGLNYSFG